MKLRQRELGIEESKLNLKWVPGFSRIKGNKLVQTAVETVSEELLRERDLSWFWVKTK